MTSGRGLAALLSSLALAAFPFCAPSASAAVPAPLPVTEVVPGLFVHQGRHEDASAANHGDIANIGFIVGKKCVAVIDTGGSAAVGEALETTVRTKTDLPVCYVVNTHMHPDHVFGNTAFADGPDTPQFVGSVRLPQALGTRAASYRASLRETLGAVAAETPVIGPSVLVNGEMRLDLGDRILVLRSWPTAHTDNDLTVFDESSSTLWLSDLLFEGRIPSLDGSIKGWLAVIGQLRALPAQRVIPGHGALDLAWPKALDAEEAYLARVAARVREALGKGMTLRETIDAADPADAAGWALADGYHRRNLTAAYAELEWE